jgi:hypothetical protein
MIGINPFDRSKLSQAKKYALNRKKGTSFLVIIMFSKNSDIII